MYKCFFKRIIDIVLSLAGLIVLALPLLAVAIAIKLDSPGPVFFKQKRVGIHKSHFMILKFRSMRIDTPKDAPTHLLQGADSYITPIGSFIRKTSIDELPQLINILKGDMSFVGPRPERPEIAEQYEKDMPEFALRLQVKAGLTGYAQVYGKYNTPPYDKVQMDLMYVANQSILEDLRLMLMTFKIMFVPSSTEGVDENQTTAKRADKSVGEKSE